MIKLQKLPFILILNIQIIISRTKIKYNRFMIICIGDFNMELNYALIGMRIKKIRRSLKMTQDRLSELSGISPQHLSQIESAKTKLSLPTLINICNALNVTADNILCDVMTADTLEQQNSDISEVFDGCSADEVYLMLAVADKLKQALRLKKLKVCDDE